MRKAWFAFGVIYLATVASAFAQSKPDARDTWIDCLDTMAALIAVEVDESADIVAAGTFGACEAKQTDAWTESYALTGSVPDMKNFAREFRELKDGVRDRVIYRVLIARAKVRKEAQSQKP